MRVCFIEDTGLRGGTQIWVSEALRDFRAKGADVTLLTSAGGWNARNACRKNRPRRLPYSASSAAPVFVVVRLQRPPPLIRIFSPR